MSKLSITLTLVISTIIFAVMGLYTGGHVFLKLADIDTSILTHTTLFDYYKLYHADKEVMKLLTGGFATGVFTALFPSLFALFIYFMSLEKEELYGSARFINDIELKESGLVDREGKYPEILIGEVLSGKYKGQLLRMRGQKFAGCAAPTRSGKGVGLVIPNCVNFADTIVVMDTKLENFRKTAGFRESVGQEVFLFSPDGFALDEKVDAANMTLRSHRWNCLSYVRRSPIYRNGDILTIADIFYPNNGGENQMWQKAAGDLFKCLVLYMLDHEDVGMNVSMPQLLKLTTPEGGLQAWMKEQIEIGKISDDCKAGFFGYCAAPDKTAGSILTNFLTPLSIFSDAVCAQSTNGDDFDLRDVRRKRMSIYIGIRPANLGRFSGLLNLFFSQLISENTQVLPEFDDTLKYQCLMILDEFTSLGRVDIIQKSIGLTAGYNMRFLIIYQTDAQLTESKNYGKDGAAVLKDNISVKSIYPPKVVDATTKEISETLGYKTVNVRKKSRTKGVTTTSYDQVQRALMMPQEIVDLGIKKYKTKKGVKTELGEYQLIIIENNRPIKAKKIIYFDIPAFAERVTYSENNPPNIPLLDLSMGDIPLPPEAKLPAMEPIVRCID
ncbi:protein VirD4 [Shewanella sairae]|uniref:Protein VirD4 n=1 Tax=Shewanella sairae TaxID=190310 RepID=A0ABQ4PLB9_9GAMM|nr:type IV secretory system conjugative DNA transfer family protein [Shewanella sairae]MCL1131886.1 type IV secretory system conjugative DNA transfer family protein [Shewanella sairae]GIU48851.1 protein VirD4 [Shewanella sairae]